ncbi:MAG: trehalose-phosphatase [Kofleriaceae bacterium]
MQHALNQPAELEYWIDLARHSALAVLVDIDGTLVDFAPRPEEAVLDATVVATLQKLIESGVIVVVVSGRMRDHVLPFVDTVPGAWWVAEHGAWQHLGVEWIGPSASSLEIDELLASIANLSPPPGARFERKSLSCCLHWRQVAAELRDPLISSLELVCDEWLQSRPTYERIAGVQVLEIRQRAVHKGLAVQLTRERVPGVRIIALGDDVTDEDMFAALGDRDLAIAVGSRQATHAHRQLAGPAAVGAFLDWISDVRAGATESPPLTTLPASHDLVVISNRTPAVNTKGRRREVGGLVAALEPALRDRRGLWLGWSGREGEDTTALTVEAKRASFDLSPEWREKFYAGFCNRVLWPLVHGLVDRVRYVDDEWHAYVGANAAYARHAVALASPDATIWVHDYHLLLVASALRRLGHRGKIGLFLHTPFPARDQFSTIPWRAELLAGLHAFDLVGFHTQQWADNFREVAGDATQVGVFPIAIDPAPFAIQEPEATDVMGLRGALGTRRLLLGVDRLDHTKGIPERLVAFEHLLEHYPAYRGEISFVQVSVPSRAEIPEYAELRQRVEKLVGRINGRYGEADWVPVRYLYRSYDHAVLAQLYRLADVALVTPLRDGMNLVAKEFVVSQDPGAPGVLVLSQYAGAAIELDQAVLTNPFHRDGMAADIDRALQMPAAERVSRHAMLLDKLRKGGTPHTWAAGFLAALAAT